MPAAMSCKLTCSPILKFFAKRRSSWKNGSPRSESYFAMVQPWASAVDAVEAVLRTRVVASEGEVVLRVAGGNNDRDRCRCRRRCSVSSPS